MSDITKWSNYETIAELDPLGFDEYVAELPDINTRADTGALADCYGVLLESSSRALRGGLDTDTAVACLRDIDFVAASLMRHGHTEIAEQDTAQRTLASLGSVACSVPRGTVFTYTSCNPNGKRQRTFTGTDEERLFIGAVREGVDALDICIDAVTETQDGKIDRLAEAERLAGVMVTSILTVKRAITPQFFTHEMRPYFDSLSIDGVAYAGAGGAQMQIIAVDRMLWGVDCDDKAYQEYFADNIRYLTPNQRQTTEAFEQSTDGKSLVSLVNEGSLPVEAALPTLGILRTIRKFRYPHRKVAKDNFAIRPDGVTGSGQYMPTILDKLIELNNNAMARLEDIAA